MAGKRNFGLQVVGIKARVVDIKDQLKDISIDYVAERQSVITGY